MTEMTFDAQPTLSGPTLILKPLDRDDFDGLFEAANDPLIWAGHPVKNRDQAEVFQPYFDFLLAKESTLAIRLIDSGEIIGCSAYYVAPGVENDISIGFTFLRRDQWGGTVNRELKTLMLDHAFKTFDTVWLHIGPDNIRSQQATAKLGAVFTHQEVLNLGGTDDEFVCYRLDRDVWQRQP